MAAPRRPIDVKSLPWSELGKDKLDEAASELWEAVRPLAIEYYNTEPYHLLPTRYYHLLPTRYQEAAQRAVLAILGGAVPALLRERAKQYKGDPNYRDLFLDLRELATEIEEEHGHGH